VLQVGVVGVQLVAAPGLALEDVEHGIKACHLVLHHGGAEDGWESLVAEIFNVAA